MKDKKIIENKSILLNRFNNRNSFLVKENNTFPIEISMSIVTTKDNSKEEIISYEIEIEWKNDIKNLNLDLIYKYLHLLLSYKYRTKLLMSVIEKKEIETKFKNLINTKKNPNNYLNKPVDLNLIDLNDFGFSSKSNILDKNLPFGIKDLIIKPKDEFLYLKNWNINPDFRVGWIVTTKTDGYRFGVMYRLLGYIFFL